MLRVPVKVTELLWQPPRASTSARSRTVEGSGAAKRDDRDST